MSLNISIASQFFSCVRRGFYKNILRSCQTAAPKGVDSCETESTSDPDMFVSDIENPFHRKKHVCIICKYNIPLDYKLLSQFISPYTGFIYGKHITGLCEAQQRRLEISIRRSRSAGFMPYVMKAAKYLRDPKLFDPFSPTRPNPH